MRYVKCIIAYFYKDENADAYAAYYTSMYLIQDTGEAVYVHAQSGFSKDAMRSYLEFWGIMQATQIQQDAIFELYKTVAGKPPAIKELTAWKELREKRNLCAGHPANRSLGVAASQRTFMGRMPRNYRQIEYELWNADSSKITHPSFDLRVLLERYEVEASRLLLTVLDKMKSRWPVKS
jgi:hypothetical protein